MIYVGIDIAKLNHFASAVFSEGEILIGLESTAHYGDNLVRYLIASHFKVCV